MNSSRKKQEFSVDYGKENTLAELLLRRAAETPDFLYAIFPTESATLTQLAERATQFAKGLVKAGLTPGEHVAILMPNCLDYMVAHFGVQLAGGVSVLLNARYRSHDLHYAVRHSDARFLVTTTQFDDAVNYRVTLGQTYPEAQEMKPGAALKLKEAPLLQKIIYFGDTEWPGALSVESLTKDANTISDAQLIAARKWQQREGTAVLYYTSGTTSRPKACEITHAGLQRSWTIFSRTVDLQPGEKVWVPMPFFHSGGVGLMAGILAAGASIASAPHFTADSTLDMIEHYKIEHLYPGFHLLASPVIDSPRFSAKKFPFIRSLVVIGPLGTTTRLQSKLPVGTPALNLFGMSEASGLITLAAYEAPETERLTTTGRALPGIEVKVCDMETGKELAHGERGEILFRGGGAFTGYYKNSEETQKTIRQDGFIRTGDLGTILDDGSLTYDGRIKDIIRVGGENVAAAEIESYMSRHDAVANVQIVGKADDRLGEVPVAFVELETGKVASEDELIAFCQGRIARFKVPTEVRFITEWPMSATKIQKFKLKELL